MVYEYRCQECEETFEKVIPMALCGIDQVCPVCGGLSPRYYGYGEVNVIIPSYFANTKSDFVCSRSSFDYDFQYKEYLKDRIPYSETENMPESKRAITQSQRYRDYKKSKAEGKDLDTVSV